MRLPYLLSRRRSTERNEPTANLKAPAAPKLWQKLMGLIGGESPTMTSLKLYNQAMKCPASFFDHIIYK